MNPTSTKIRVADYIAKTAVRLGSRHVFLITGGGAMHLNDAFGRRKDLKVVCCHHEQACAMAAESYARMSGEVPVVNVTTGPGGLNTLTGVWGGYVDSVPMVIISGQVKFETTVRSTSLPLRQLGDQELDIVRVVQSICKYAVMVTDASSIRYHLERAYYLARTGRPGPVWLDIPMNVQGALIDEATLEPYDPKEDELNLKTPDLKAAVERTIARLRTAKRPVILAGGGVRASKSHSLFLEFIERLGIPVTTGWNAQDLLWDEHPLYSGRPGIIGNRGGNFAVQNSDFLLILGSRLNIRQVSYAWDLFARHAHKVMVDIDEAELQKPTLKIDEPIHADLQDFLKVALDVLRDQAQEWPLPAHRDYVCWCRERNRKYPTVLPEYWQTKDAVNPYCFVDSLFKQLPENELVVTGDGTACVVTFQAAQIKKGQRLYTNSGCASMGYDLPAAIGACIATGAERLICIAGDGSIQMNLQELQTIITHRLPIKLFVLYNKGYHSIRQAQQSYFPDNIVGCGEEDGLGFPDFGRLAAAYGIPYRRAANHDELAIRVRETLEGPGVQMCEVVLDLNQQFAPKLSSRKLADGRMISAPLEDLSPFLPREEFAANMLVPILEEW
jgi:acetolactate synthase-1/2/3 large subunit